MTNTKFRIVFALVEIKGASLQFTRGPSFGPRWGQGKSTPLGLDFKCGQPETDGIKSVSLNVPLRAGQTCLAVLSASTREPSHDWD